MTRTGVIEWIVALVLAALLTVVGLGPVLSASQSGSSPSFNPNSSNTVVLICGIHQLPTLPTLADGTLQDFAALS